MTIKEQTIKVDVADEHLKRFSQSNPLDAIIELIWNSIDAGSTLIKVNINRNAVEGIESIEVVDNGFGIKFDEVESTFGKLGKSQKQSDHFNPRGKRYHGSLGEGRFKAYSLGNQIEWKSKDHSSKRISIIKGSTSEIGKYKISRADDDLKFKGTHFLALNGNSEKLRLGSDEKISEKLLTIFAPTLLSDKDLRIELNGLTLDPEGHIERIEDLETPPDLKIKCRLIIWKTGDSSSLFWSGLDLKTKFEQRLEDIRSQHGFSLFLGCSKVDKAVQEGTIEIPELAGMAKEKDAATEAAKKFLKSYDEAKVIKTVQLLKESETYPAVLP